MITIKTYWFIWWCILSLIFLITTVYAYIHRDEPDWDNEDFPPYIALAMLTLFFIFCSGFYFVE